MKSFSSSLTVCVKTITPISIYIFPSSFNQERKLKIRGSVMGLSVGLVSNTFFRVELVKGLV